ncbi:HNM1-choline permease [Fusarium circinatum]|uniref:HNM1-choline permease n=1 Tax=Fusarium circinatum TaxID=48490 RepID=A0A8H5X4I5_FUSCI|nr:HNM1-choline permease [Fusarium circinatum]
MSRSSLDDRESHESHDRLLKNGDDHLIDSRGWETHLGQSSKQRIFNHVSFIAFTSLLLNILLIVSFLCLWLRTRSPLPPWPDTLYSQSAVEYEIVTFNSDFPEDHSGTTDFYGASLKAEDAWRNLMKPYLVRISGQEASKLSRPTSQISRDPDYYITSLDVYHQLHCLNDIRKMNQDISATGSEITHVFQCWFYNPEIVFLNASSEHALVTLPLTDFELHMNMSLDMASPAIGNEKHLGSQNQDEQNLERHGYVQQTKRNFSLTAMVATCVNLMATWEALSSTLAAGLVSGGAVSLVYGVIVAFIGSLCSASSLAELASSYPTAGGQYHFVAKLSPKTSRPLTSWFAGYISTLGWIASAGSAPFLAGTQIQGLLVLNYPDSYVFQRWHGTLLFWAVLLGSACICIFCSNKLPLIEKLTLVLHVTFFIAIIVTMAVTSPTKHSAEWVFSHFENNSGWGNDAVAWSIGLLSSCYVLIGYDGATHLSEEMNNAEMGVPRAMVGCLLVNGPLGFAFLLIILFFMGDISAALATPTGFPIIEIFLHMTGSVAAATTMTAMITVMACLSTVPLLTAAARIMWAFARDQGLPFAERIASVDKRRQIPTVSIIVVSFLLMLLSLINIGSTTAFNAILSLAVVSLQASYLLPIILLIWRRLFRPDTLRWGPWRLGKAGLPINIIAVIYLLYTCIFLLFPPYQPITPVNMNYAPVVLGGALIFGCIYWPLRVSKRYVGPLTDAEVLEGTLH